MTHSGEELYDFFISSIDCSKIENPLWLQLITNNKDTIQHLLLNTISIGFSIREFCEACQATTTPGLQRLVGLTTKCRNELIFLLAKNRFLLKNPKHNRWVLNFRRDSFIDKAFSDYKAIYNKYHERVIIIDGMNITGVLDMCLDMDDYQFLKYLYEDLDSYLEQRKYEFVRPIAREIIYYCPEQAAAYVYYAISSYELDRALYASDFLNRAQVILNGHKMQPTDWLRYGISWLNKGHYRSTLSAFHECLITMKGPIVLEKLGRKTKKQLFDIIIKMLLNANRQSDAKEFEIFWSQLDDLICRRKRINKSFQDDENGLAALILKKNELDVL